MHFVLPASVQFGTVAYFVQFPEFMQGLHFTVLSRVTRHFGHKTLRHQDTLGHFSTGLKTLGHQKRGTRHFDTSAVIEEKPDTSTQDYSDETQLHR